MRPFGPIAVTLLAVASLSACANSESPSTLGTTTRTQAPAASAPAVSSTTSAAASQGECTADDIQVSGAAGTEPKVTLPEGCAPPKAMVSKDLAPGEGEGAKQGGTVVTHYHLTTWSDRQVKDASWKRGEPFPVANLGQARVIDGWNEGLVGIKKGARRLLIVPPDKGYGQGGQGIAPNETLVFVIDAVDVT